MKKRKYILLIALSAIMLMGCKASETKSELSDYYLSLTSSSRINENEISVENHIYDFETNKMNTENYKMNLTAKYSLAVYDDKGKAVLYSAKDVNGNDEVYRYDLKTKKSEQLTDNLWGINYIEPREKDYIVVGVPQIPHDSKVLMLWSIDRNTKEVRNIEIPHDKYKDISVWQVAYVPETDGLILQTYSDSEAYELQDKWNSMEEHPKDKELTNPFYYYQYVNGEMKYLFEKDMPQSMGIVANRNDILFAVQSEIEGNNVFRYNIKDNKVDKMKSLETLEKVFYLDEKSENVYRFNGKIGKINLKTGKEEWLDSNFKESYFNNYMLLKK